MHRHASLVHSFIKVSKNLAKCRSENNFVHQNNYIERSN